jgi:non-ribosomal peptide synthetase-like protein
MRKWAVALAVEMTLETLSSLFATVYMRNWYRLMGAKIGKDAEISTNLAGRYDLVEIGEKCFIADEVVLGDEDIRRGWMTLASHVKTGSRVFIGNDGVVPPGAIIPAGALIGIKSKPPANELMSAGRHLVRLAADQAAGAPAVRRRRRDLDLRAAEMEKADARRVRGRAYLAADHAVHHLRHLGGRGLRPGSARRQLQCAVPLLDVHRCPRWLISMALTSVVIGIKWATMGRYEPVVKPMWSFWAMRTEAVAVMYWGMAGKVLPRPSARHALPALDAAPVRREDRPRASTWT